MAAPITLAALAFLSLYRSQTAATRINNCTLLQQALDVAIAAKQPLFRLPHGDIKCVHDFVVLGASDMAILGQETTTFWFEPSRAGFRVMSCRNLTVASIIVDHDRLFVPIPNVHPGVKLHLTRNFTSQGASGLRFDGRPRTR